MKYVSAKEKLRLARREKELEPVEMGEHVPFVYCEGPGDRER